MNSPKRHRARVLTASGLEKLRAQRRSHEVEENAGYKYSLERLGELTGLDPETVRNVVDCKGSDKRTLSRFFETFGLTLEDSDHIQAVQAWAAPPDPNFVGRDEAIADLNTLVSRNAKVIVIQARGGVGKTTLARKYLQQEFGSFLEFPIAKETKDIASIEGLLEEKLRQLGEEPGREFLVSIDRLKRKLQTERIGILIDNLEPALDSAGKFVEVHRRYVELLRVLSDPTVKSITLITSRERLREADVTVQHYPLRSLNVQAWEQFFQSHSINTETPALAALHNAYGGNAKAMDIISGAVLEDFSGDAEAYWQANQDDLFIERDLEDLVTKQFNRLQQLDSEAYKLLCRMGCYRYQDVPTVPIEGLFCLLWDVPENHHRRVIKSLQDRSLVDFEDGKFWLHSAVRKEAITRLRNNEDWEISNRKAGEFWTKSVETVESVNDALRAIEPYHHYLNLDQVEEAGQTIRFKRRYRLGSDENLGRSCYRLGLLNLVVFLINILLDQESLISGQTLCALHNTLGASYYFMGNIDIAINSHLKSNKLAIEFNLLEFQILSILNIGFCKIDLFELEEAKCLFEDALSLAWQTEFHRHAVDALCCLAYISSIQDQKEACSFLEKSLCEYKRTADFTTWGRGNSKLFIGMAYKNLGDESSALQIFHEVVIYAEDSQYIQLKARALNCMAELFRARKNFEAAILNHSISSSILSDIGAKLDLAEVYYQSGLTYKVIGEIEKSNENFQKAIRLFAEMEAPKHVERVRKSMQNS